MEKWFKGDTIPSLGTRIIVVHDYCYGCTSSYRTLAGTFIKFYKEGSIYCYKLKLSDNSNVDFSVDEIHAWAYEQDITEEAVRTANERPIEVYCPRCKEKLEVIAELHNITYAEMPVLENTLTGDIRQDWDSISSESDFKYVCKECRKKLANTFEELVNLQKKKAQPFTDDPDKVLDLLLLSKEEFLKSYSYITEAEYNATVEDIKNNFEKKG